MMRPAPAAGGRMECMPTRVSARISAISESATLAVDTKAKALRAAGRPVIGFGAGEPDFPTPDYIVEAAQRACAEPRFHKYTPAAGLPELREAVAAKTARDSSYQVSASQVLITNGGKHAVYQTFATLLDPGDEVLLPTPYWTTYPEAIALAGGVPVPGELTPAATNLQSHATSNVCTVAQAAALTAVTGDLSAVAKMRAAFGRRRLAMTTMLNEIPGVICPLPEGAFYCYPSVKGVLGRELAGSRPATSGELAEVILDHADVAVVPGEAFGTPGYFRLSCALGDADLEEGITRLGKLLAQAR